ncbi:MAG: TlpA disulfide reductase family protein, partial [Bacteroidota bacterium]
YETNKMLYFIYNSERISPNQLRQYWVRYALLQTVDISDEKSLSYEGFQNLLESFIHYLYLETPVESEDLGREYYRFIERNLSGRCRYFMLARLLIDNYVGANNSGLVQRMFKNFKAFNPYPEYTAALDDMFGDAMQYVAKDIVPNFSVKTETGQAIELLDLQGKVVHISFWASWCAPCLEGFRESFLTRQQLQSQGVVLLNINLDKTEETWKRTLQRENIQGTNVYATDISNLKQRYGIKALPFYLTVDKFGQRTFLSTPDLNVAQRDLMELVRR